MPTFVRHPPARCSFSSSCRLQKKPFKDVFGDVDHDLDLISCYSEYQGVFDSYTNVEFNDGLPDLNTFDAKSRSLLVLDDLMSNTDDRVVALFTNISHHRNLSVVYLTQNLFYKNKQTRTLSFNTHYIVLFKNAYDAS